MKNRTKKGKRTLLVAGILTLLAMLGYAVSGLASVNETAAMNKSAMEQGVAPIYPDEEGDRAWAALHSYLETVPAPTYACFEDRYWNLSAADALYFTENPDLSSWENQEDCSRVYAQPYTFIAEPYSRYWFNESERLYDRTNTPIDRLMDVCEEGFANAAEYADYFFEMATATGNSRTIITTADSGEQIETYEARSEIYDNPPPTAKVMLVKEWLKNTPYAYAG